MPTIRFALHSHMAYDLDDERSITSDNYLPAVPIAGFWCDVPYIKHKAEFIDWFNEVCTESTLFVHEPKNELQFVFCVSAELSDADYINYKLRWE